MTLSIDRASLLVAADGAAPLASIEKAIAADGLTLRVAGLEADASSMLDTTVADWLGRGAPGAAVPFADPADHLVAGIVATLPDGRRLEIRPSPRRAVGPDLLALFVGARGRFGAIERAWLRVHPLGARPVESRGARDLAVDAPLSAGEEALLDAIARELRAAR